MPKRSADKKQESTSRVGPALKRAKKQLSDAALVKGYANKWAEKYRKVLERDAEQATEFEQVVTEAIDYYWMDEIEWDAPHIREMLDEYEKGAGDAGADAILPRSLQEAKTPAAAAVVKDFAEDLVEEFRAAFKMQYVDEDECSSAFAGGRMGLRRLDWRIANLLADDGLLMDEDDEETL